MTPEFQGSNPHSLSRAKAWLLSLLIWAAAAAIIGVAMDWIPSAPGTVHGPRWVLAAAGMAIGAAGFAPIAAATQSGSWASQIAGLGTLCAMTVIANWIAFGSGHRQFSGGFGIGGFGLSQGHQSEIGGRIIFGIAALLLDAFVAMSLLRALRGRKSSQRDEP